MDAQRASCGSDFRWVCWSCCRRRRCTASDQFSPTAWRHGPHHGAEQYDLYDGHHFVISANRIYMVGGLNDSEGGDHTIMRPRTSNPCRYGGDRRQRNPEHGQVRSTPEDSGGRPRTRDAGGMSSARVRTAESSSTSMSTAPTRRIHLAHARHDDLVAGVGANRDRRAPADALGARLPPAAVAGLRVERGDEAAFTNRLILIECPSPCWSLAQAVRGSFWPGRDQKLQQITLSTSLTMIELPVTAGCAHSADCAISYRRTSSYF